MYTVAETEEFTESASKIWSEDEKSEFINFLSQHPFAGDVIPKSSGFRKIRWTAKNKGKRSGVRVIYYNVLENGMIICFTIYAKNELENISTSRLKR